MHLTSDDSKQRELGSAWAVLSQSEARGLYESLRYYFAEANPDPGWHCHVGDDGPELTIAIET